MSKFHGLLALALTVASPAFAGPTLTFDLDQISSAQIGSGILGTVVLTQLDDYDVDVTVKVAPHLFVNTGGSHTPFAFNNTLSGLSVSSFLAPVGGVYASGTFSYDSAGGGNTPYGTFGRAIDSSAGNGSGDGYLGTLEFIVTRSGGGTLDTTDFGHNSGGYYFSADLSNGTDTGAVATLAGRFISPPGNASVPEPTSLMIIGSALVGLGSLARPRRRA